MNILKKPAGDGRGRKASLPLSEALFACKPDGNAGNFARSHRSNFLRMFLKTGLKRLESRQAGKSWH